ncbi:unnamed protein product, partial [Acidithrix sp. C25]
VDIESNTSCMTMPDYLDHRAGVSGPPLLVLEPISKLAYSRYRLKTN